MKDICLICHIEYPINYLQKDLSTKKGYRKRCKACTAKKSSSWRRDYPDRAKKAGKNQYNKVMKNNPLKKIDDALKFRYGISLEYYNEILLKQNCKCAICFRTAEETNCSRLYVDHCHITKYVRGLLCRNCNLAIGYLQDNHHVAFKAADYLVDNFIKSQF